MFERRKKAAAPPEVMHSHNSKQQEQIMNMAVPVPKENLSKFDLNEMYASLSTFDLNEMYTSVSPGSVLAIVGVLANVLLFVVSVYFLFGASSSPKKKKDKTEKTVKKGRTSKSFATNTSSHSETDETASLAESDEASSSSSLDAADSIREERGVTLYGPYPKNTLTPWTNMRNEGREGDTIDPAILASTKNWVDLPSDFRDKGTPDEWIPRDGRMVRLTGRHPFNSEPPVACLNETGFLTPANLHIIRNHGAVPKLDWETHQLVIDGPLVTKPLTLSMDALTTEFPTTEFPVSISCCGNRRKEMNMIKQTIGFNWGSGACGTNVYKGVLLRDLLAAAGIDLKETSVAGKYVEFIGTDDLPNKSGGPGPFEDEPWGDKVKYGTSIPLAKCLDPADEVMVAFQANGERLHPDRGYPIRLVIPGYIGGRMIKWLAQIRVIPHESKNCYHYWDNKYMPPQVTAEIAAKDGWWYKQEYIINELSLNSLICKPNHGDVLPLSASNIDKPFEISGYAHSGGGRMVTRVECSTDMGATWELATIHRTEQPNPYGKYWCWVWWSYQVPAVASLGEEIWCRAWDTSNSPQPHTPTWTLMGQSSNHIFRVKIRTTKYTSGQVVFRFEHPTQPGQQSGGWATKLADKVKHAGYGMIPLGDE